MTLKIHFVFGVLTLLVGMFSSANDLSCPENKKSNYPDGVTLSENANCLWHFSGIKEGHWIRDFSLDSQGMMEVHLLDDRSKRTVTRAYLTFPLRQHPKVEYAADSKKLIVHLASGDVMEFSEDDHQLLTYTGGSVKEDVSFKKSQQSGFDITNSKDILFDCGSSSASNTTFLVPGSCKITDARGLNCEIPRSQLFSETHYDPIPRYPTNESMARFLKNRCPQLKLWDPHEKFDAPITEQSTTTAAPAIVPLQMPADAVVVPTEVTGPTNKSDAQ